MKKSAIKIEGIGKRYRIGKKEERADTLVGLVLNTIKAPVRSFRNLRGLSVFEKDEGEDIVWALRDVSFEIKQGETVGLIGRNGAGKSTLLKVLSRITEPTTGHIDVYGRVSSLLEVGTGFHPELTGRENVYLNGTILGMKKAEIDRKFDEIVDFSGVEQYIDTPVKRYSSGMKVRLGFAVAAHLEPDILLVDEVLAVGDVAFQKKCIGKMESVADEGRTVVFVSHQMSMIQALCKRGIVMNKGGVIFDGTVDDAVAEYLRQMEQGAQNPFENNPHRSGNRRVQFTDIRIRTEEGFNTEYLIAGKPVEIEFDYSCRASVKDVSITFTIFNGFGTAVSNISFPLTGFTPDVVGDKGTFICRLPSLPLVPGAYRIAAALHAGNEREDLIPNAIHFQVVSSVFFPTGKTPDPHYGSSLIEHSWSHRLESPILAEVPKS